MNVWEVIYTLEAGVIISFFMVYPENKPLLKRMPIWKKKTKRGRPRKTK